MTTKQKYMKEYYKGYYQKRKHILLPKQREYQHAHKEEQKARKRKWIAEHKDEWREYCRNKMREHYRRKHPNSKMYKDTTDAAL